MDQGPAADHGPRHRGQPGHQGNGHRQLETERSVHLEPAVPGGRGRSWWRWASSCCVLVREAPTASYGAEADRKERARPTRDELRDILAGPNAKVLVGGSLLFWSGVGSTAYVAILFFQRILHAGASAQTIAGLATGLPVFFIGIALGIPLSRWLTPMQLAIGAPLAGAVLAGVQYFDTHLWQAVVLSYIGAPLIGAYIIVMAPLLLQLLPRAGGLGERLGVLLAPFNLCSVVLAYVAAIVIDATGNYRLIWLFPAATGLGQAMVNCWLKYPARRASSPDMVKRLWEWSVVQAESMAETGIVTGLLAAPLLGVVTEEDADSAVVIDMARNILGNPYEDPEPTPGPADRARPSVRAPVGRRTISAGSDGRRPRRCHRRAPGRRGPGRRRRTAATGSRVGRTAVTGRIRAPTGTGPGSSRRRASGRSTRPGPDRRPVTPERPTASGPGPLGGDPATGASSGPARWRARAPRRSSGPARASTRAGPPRAGAGPTGLEPARAARRTR